ncbi:MAG TPA: hypothetical protein PKD86_00725 [Gemmatales bacterium]|nr:hypothetical protein [Gemmatales bacterium]
MDTWWHLRVGQWIVEHQDVPRQDPFSRYGLETGQDWRAYSWLYELALYHGYATWGWHGIVFFRAVQGFLVAWAWLLFTTRYPNSVLWSALLFLLGYFSFFLMTLSERPWLLSMMMGMWTVAVMQDLRAGSRRWHHWLLPLGYVLWANWHIQFIYGLALLGVGVLAPLFDRWLGWEQDEPAQLGSASWQRLLLIALLCAAGTLVNPFHVSIYQVVWEYASQPGAFAYVYELTAPNFRRREDWLCVGLAGLALFLLGRQRGLSTFQILLIVGPTFAGLRAKRDQWYLLVGVVAVLSELRFTWLSLPAAASWPRWTQLAVPAGLVLLAASGSWRLQEAAFVTSEEESYPVAAVAHIRAQGYPGPIFNHFDWGGYLIWRLPEYPVAMDGRTNLHGDARIEASLKAWGGEPGWQDLPELRSARVLLVQQKSPLGQLLRLHPRFRLVFEDQRSSVFVADP